MLLKGKTRCCVSLSVNRFTTPVLKKSADPFDDVCSTALPSPETHFEASPWSTPSPCASMLLQEAGLTPMSPPRRERAATSSRPSDCELVPFGDLSGAGLLGAVLLQMFERLSFSEFASRASAALETPPATPRNARRPRYSLSDSPPPAPKRAPYPPLLVALMNNSTEAVRATLERDPEAATTPFWDHGLELPACAARRLRCDAAVVALLPGQPHGADGEAFMAAPAGAAAFAPPPFWDLADLPPPPAFTRMALSAAVAAGG